MNKTIGNALNHLTTPRGTDAGILLLRIAAGIMMFTHGWAKASNYGELSAVFADPIGIGSKLSLSLIMLVETACPILIILGLFTRLASLLLVVGMGVAAFATNTPFSLSGSELSLLYLLIFIALTVSGAGRYSADHYIWRHTSSVSR